MTKRRMFYFLVLLSAGLITALIGIVTSYRVRLYEHHVDTGFDCTIAQISDPHFTERFDPTPFHAMREKINDTSPDILVFTGDLFQIDQISDSLEEDVTTFLKQFDATYKYAVLGNHDYYKDDKHTVVKRILVEAGFTILINQDVTLTINDEEIHLIGLDDLRFGDTNYSDILQTAEQHTHNVVIAHEPDTYNIVQDYEIDIMLAGHSHGGQVRLPLIGSIINVEGATDYNERFYNEQGTKLFISFGMGESLLPIRMFNPRAMEVFRCS